MEQVGFATTVCVMVAKALTFIQDMVAEGKDVTQWSFLLVISDILKCPETAWLES